MATPHLYDVTIDGQPCVNDAIRAVWPHATVIDQAHRTAGVWCLNARADSAPVIDGRTVIRYDGHAVTIAWTLRAPAPVTAPEPSPRPILDPEAADKFRVRGIKTDRLVFLGTGGNFDYYGNPDDSDRRVYYVGCVEGCGSGLFGEGWYWRQGLSSFLRHVTTTEAGRTWSVKAVR